MSSFLFDLVKTPRPPRSLFDLSHDNKMSLKFGKMYPILIRETNPGDEYKLTTEFLVKMQPLIAPLMHRLDVKLEFFDCPNRILYDNQKKWEKIYCFDDNGMSNPESSIKSFRMDQMASAFGLFLAWRYFPQLVMNYYVYNDWVYYKDEDVYSNITATPLKFQDGTVSNAVAPWYWCTYVKNGIDLYYSDDEETFTKIDTSKLLTIGYRYSKTEDDVISRGATLEEQFQDFMTLFDSSSYVMCDQYANAFFWKNFNPGDYFSEFPNGNVTLKEIDTYLDIRLLDYLLVQFSGVAVVANGSNEVFIEKNPFLSQLLAELNQLIGVGSLFDYLGIPPIDFNSLNFVWTDVYQSVNVTTTVNANEVDPTSENVRLRQGYSRFNTNDPDANYKARNPELTVENRTNWRVISGLADDYRLPNSYKSTLANDDIEDYSTSFTYPDTEINQNFILAYNKIYNDYYRSVTLQPDRFNLEDWQQFTDHGLWYFNFLDFFVLKNRNWQKDYFTGGLPDTQLGTPVEVQVDDGSFTVEALTVARRVQQFLTNIFRAGTRYEEQVRTRSGVTLPNYLTDEPLYLGGQKQPVIINEILQTSESNYSAQGNATGHGMSSQKSFDFKHRCLENGWIIGVVTIFPRTSYMQGLPRQFTRLNRLDFPSYYFANLGEQPVFNYELYWSKRNADESLDKEFSYMPYETRLKYIQDSVHGDFRTSLNYWHMARMFDSQPKLNADFISTKDVRTDIFAVQDGSDYLYAEFYFDFKSIQNLPKFSTPNY